MLDEHVEPVRHDPALVRPVDVDGEQGLERTLLLLADERHGLAARGYGGVDVAPSLGVDIAPSGEWGRREADAWQVPYYESAG